MTWRPKLGTHPACLLYLKKTHVRSENDSKLLSNGSTIPSYVHNYGSLWFFSGPTSTIYPTSVVINNASSRSDEPGGALGVAARTFDASTRATCLSGYSFRSNMTEVPGEGLGRYFCGRDMTI